ncbi:hypothetical protein INR49_020917 [Caranx melampygus]|nr:hypothetical protein INR49_020917 [Caranx melampygus]
MSLLMCPGYWRKQVDHVCAHLRSYAQNNTPFRTLLGEPPVVQDDGYEVSVTVSFVAAGRGQQVGSDASAGLKPHKPNLMPKPPVKDSQLLKELGPGRGQISVIQQLLDQGADASCCGSDERHALVVAVVNGHHDLQGRVRRRNAAGQTPYDVAVSSGCNNMVSLLAAQTGLDLLGKLGKPKLNLDLV